MQFLWQLHFEMLFLLAFAGLLISILSALETRVKWIASFCSIFGDGCRKTEAFTLFRIPISWWGILYYLGLLLVLLFAKPLVYWVVLAGFGVELTFVLILAIFHIFCIFCTLNGLVIAFLFLLVVELHRMWENLLIPAAFFILFYFLLERENVSQFRKTVDQGQLQMDKSPSLGPEDAPVTIVEFSDYLCPACRKAHVVSHEIKEKYKNRVQWIFKDFPLEMHPGADRMAHAARCAGKQNKFWEYQDRMFCCDEEPTKECLTRYAKDMGLDVKAFKKCLDDPATMDRIIKDKQEGKDAGVTATPTFFVNDTKLTGIPDKEELGDIIDEEIEKNQ